MSVARKREKQARPSPVLLPAEDAQSSALHVATPYAVETDFADAAYAPHTVTAGAVLLSLLYVLAHSYAEPTEMLNVKLGMAAAAWTFIVFGIIHLPDGIMTRPHPALWRGVLAVGTMYLVFIIFMSFQDHATAMKIAGFYDASLLLPRPDVNYAEDCRMSTPEEPYKFFDTVFDEFILAHAMGYWAKTLVLRDWRVVTAVSVGFEIIEVSFQHVLPNFAECWWDHLIVDVVICNAGGTLLGLLTLRLINAKQFHWVKLKNIPSIKGKAKRVLGQLAPRAGVVRYQWHMFDSPKRFVLVLMVLAVMFIQDVNCFTLKHMLNIPPPHPLVIGRMVMWGVIALPGMLEFYSYIDSPARHRIGTIAWVGAAALLFETMWSIKLIRAEGFFAARMPIHIAVPWLYALAAFGAWVVLYFSTPRRVRYGAGAGARLWAALLNALFLSMFVAWAALFVMGNNDLRWYQVEFDAWVLSTGWW
jgi:phosphatidylserine synthase 2